MARVAFLLFHHIHHAPHVLPIARALARRPEHYEIQIFSSSAQNDALCARYLAPEDGIEVVRIARETPLPPGYNFPEPRVAMREAAGRLRDMDAIVTSSFEDLTLREAHGATRPRFVLTFHGAGDGAYGFSPEVARFDLLLLSGRKTVERLAQAGVLERTAWSVTGYPKFDLLPSPLPPSDARTALYNPHWDPKISSWVRFGTHVLEYFAAHPEWRLIFAPHVLLVGPRRPLDLGKYEGCGNIRIDLGSQDAVDMSHPIAAGLYIGDASSQVYEFLYRPRPCLFLNPGITGWENDPNYRHWRCGTVWTDPDDIGTGLARALAEHAAYESVQREAFAHTFALTDRPSSERAAEAIVASLR